MLAPLVQNQPEYGFVLQNFWNNANQKIVKDPFGMVKQAVGETPIYRSNAPGLDSLLGRQVRTG